MKNIAKGLGDKFFVRGLVFCLVIFGVILGFIEVISAQQNAYVSVSDTKSGSSVNPKIAIIDVRDKVTWISKTNDSSAKEIAVIVPTNCFDREFKKKVSIGTKIVSPQVTNPGFYEYTIKIYDSKNRVIRQTRGAYIWVISAPTQQEKNLFDTKLARYNRNKAIAPHPVDDVIKSFTQPVVIKIECQPESKMNTVEITIKTEQVKWEPAAMGDLGAHSEAFYFWNCHFTSSGKKKTVTCRNFVMIDPSAAQTSENSGEFGKGLDVTLFYHEMLHGQLLIDAMNTNAWKKKVCNCEFDLGPMDREHKRIYGLESTFRDKIMGAKGYTVSTQRVTTHAAVNGNFDVSINVNHELKNKWRLNNNKYKRDPIVYTPPNGNIESVTWKYAGHDGNIRIKGKLSDSTKPGVVKVYVDPEDVCELITVDIYPYEEIYAVPAITPPLFVLALLLLLVLGAIVMRKMYRE